MTASVQIKNDRLGEVADAVEALTGNAVLVGVPSTTAGRREISASNAVIAYVHEHGSPAQNIPPRPFLVPGLLAIREELADRLEDAANTALGGDRPNTIRALHAIGLVAQAAIRRKITDGPFAPLAAATLAARRARGVTRTKPLIDTGQLRASINYVLRGRWFSQP